MILILSEDQDTSCNQTLEWLQFFSKDFIRINSANGLKVISSVQYNGDQVKIILEKENGIIDLDSISSVWFRRGYFSKSPISGNSDIEYDIRQQVIKHLLEESETLHDFIFLKLKEKKSLNHPNHYNINKLIALDNAAKSGLAIPPTLITKSKDHLLNWRLPFNDLITKNIQDILTVKINELRTSQSTYLITDEIIKEMPDGFYFSLFQKAINRKYELRIFYLAGKCYSCAIFTKFNNLSERDGRNLVNERGMVRVVPYQLPAEVDIKINTLMKQLNLESGSIDMIVDEDDVHYFIEVNPVGQYDYVSKLCNYNLDMKVA